MTSIAFTPGEIEAVLAGRKSQTMVLAPTAIRTGDVLCVTDTVSIVVERVREARPQDLTVDDALAEGITRIRLGDADGFVLPDGAPGLSFTKSARVALGLLWDRKRSGPLWVNDPLVAVLHFRRAEGAGA